MKTSRYLLLVVAALGLFGIVDLVCAQGTGFTYQGRLSNGSSAANGSFDLRFTLYDATNAPGNVVAGPITMPGLAVSNGVFAATLDFGAGVFNGSARWLEVAVRTNGAGFSFVTLTPRQAITASPYAVTAGSVAGVIPSGSLAGTYSGAVTFSNVANVFAGTFNGNGAGLTGVNAATVGGVSVSGIWKLNGNAVAPGQFIGSTNNQPLDLWAGGTRVLRLEPDSRVNTYAGNLIGGYTNNSIEQPGSGGNFIGGGGYFAGPNIIRSNSSGVFIGGGSANQVGPGVGDAFIGGGFGNFVQGSANRGVIGGGLSNTNNGFISAIVGGRINVIGSMADHSFIGGGTGNQITGSETSPTVANVIAGGGFSHILTNAIFSTIGGGFQNNIQSGADGATIGGGYNNRSGGQYSTVPGGFNNQAIGNYSFAAGLQANANHQGTFVWADSLNAAFTSTANDQFLIRAAGGVGIGTASPGASLHIHNDSASPLDRIRFSGRGSWNGGGVGDTNGIALGLGVNDVNNRQLWITESSRNNASSTNLAIRLYPWNGGGIGIVDCVGTDGFAAKNLGLQVTGGNVGIGTTNPTNKLQVAGGITCTALVQTSDRDAKENFAAVSSREVLAKVIALPISRWTYKDMKDGSHIGPMAQDFYAAFGLGGSDKTITSVDPDGVALAAIQGLNEKLEEKQKEIEVLQTKVAKVDALEKAVAELSRRLGETGK